MLNVKDDDKSENLSPNVLWEILFKSFELKSLVGSSINVPSSLVQEGRLPNGLVVGHVMIFFWKKFKQNDLFIKQSFLKTPKAYSILEAFELISNDGTYNELRKTYEEKKDGHGFFLFSDKAIKLLR